MTERGELTVEDVVLQVVLSSFQLEVTNGSYYKFLSLLIFTIAIVPGLIRLYYGIPMFGHVDEPAIVCIHVGMFFATFFGGSNTLLFCITSAIDLIRRVVALKQLMKIMQYPGLPYQNLFPENENIGNAMWSNADDRMKCCCEGHKTRYLYFDLERENNCYSWLLARRVLKVIGENFYRRSLKYIAICVSWSTAASLALNMIVWLQIPHHMATVGAIGIGILAVMVQCSLAFKHAQSLQECAPEQRLILKRKLVALTQEAMILSNKNVMEATSLRDTESGSGSQIRASCGLTRSAYWKHPDDKAQAARLQTLKEVIQKVEELIRFEDEDRDPVTVFGVTAGPEMISAIFSILVALLGLAIQQIFSTSFLDGYDDDGWYSPTDYDD